MIPDWLWGVIILSSAGMVVRNSDRLMAKEGLSNHGIVSLILLEFLMHICLTSYFVFLLYTPSGTPFLAYVLLAFLSVLVEPAWRAHSKRTDLPGNSMEECAKRQKRDNLIDTILGVPEGLLMAVVFAFLASRLFNSLAEYLLSNFSRSLFNDRIIYAIIISSVVMTVISKVAWKNNFLSFLFLIPAFLCVAILSNLNFISDYFLPFILFVCLAGLMTYIVIDSSKFLYRRHEHTSGSSDEVSPLT